MRLSIYTSVASGHDAPEIIKRHFQANRLVKGTVHNAVDSSRKQIEGVRELSFSSYDGVMYAVRFGDEFEGTWIYETNHGPAGHNEAVVYKAIGYIAENGHFRLNEGVDRPSIKHAFYTNMLKLGKLQKVLKVANEQERKAQLSEEVKDLAKSMAMGKWKPTRPPKGSGVLATWTKRIGDIEYLIHVTTHKPGMAAI